MDRTAWMYQWMLCFMEQMDIDMKIPICLEAAIANETENLKVLRRYTTAIKPHITMVAYFKHMWQYGTSHMPVYFRALAYLQLFIVKHPSIHVTALNIHRLFLSAVLIAHKFDEDDHWNNTRWAKVGGVPSREINQLEIQFCSDLDFDLYLTPEQYTNYFLTNLRSHHSSKPNCVCKAQRVLDMSLDVFVSSLCHQFTQFD